MSSLPHLSVSRVTAIQRPLMSSNVKLVGCLYDPVLLAAVATHPLLPHTDRIFHVSLPAGSVPGSGLPDKPMLWPKARVKVPVSGPVFAVGVFVPPPPPPPPLVITNAATRPITT